MGECFEGTGEIECIKSGMNSEESFERSRCWACHFGLAIWMCWKRKG